MEQACESTAVGQAGADDVEQVALLIPRAQLHSYIVMAYIVVAYLVMAYIVPGDVEQVALLIRRTQQVSAVP